MAHGHKPRKKQARKRRIKEKRLEYIERTVSIYGGWLEREPREEDLYTEYELKHIEELYPEETGRINWSSWTRLVNEYRSKLQNERSWKHEPSIHNP